MDCWSKVPINEESCGRKGIWIKELTDIMQRRKVDILGVLGDQTGREGKKVEASEQDSCCFNGLWLGRVME